MKRVWLDCLPPPIALAWAALGALIFGVSGPGFATVAGLFLLCILTAAACQIVKLLERLAQDPLTPPPAPAPPAQVRRPTAVPEPDRTIPFRTTNTGRHR